MKVWATSNSGPGTKTKKEVYHCKRPTYISKSILDGSSSHFFTISSSNLRLRQVQTKSQGSRCKRQLGQLLWWWW